MNLIKGSLNNTALTSSAAIRRSSSSTTNTTKEEEAAELGEKEAGGSDGLSMSSAFKIVQQEALQVFVAGVDVFYPHGDEQVDS